MDLVSLSTLTFLVVFAGFVAYWGDLIGRKLGKQRLKIGRLRPRHTAALMTGIFGMLATLLAILALFALSEPVRVWITEGNLAKSKLRIVEGQLDQRVQELSQQRQKLDQTSTDLAAQGKRLTEAQKKVRAAEASAADLRRMTAELQGQGRRLRGELNATLNSLRTTRQEFTALRKQAEQTRRTNDQAIRFNAEISRQNLELDQELQRKNTELGSLRQRIDGLNADIEALNKELKDANERATRELNGLRERVGAAQQELADSQEELTRRRAELEQLRRFIDTATTAARTRPMTFNRGDELARVVVGDRLSAAEAGRAFDEAVVLASRLAQEAGAGPQPGTREYAGLIEVQQDGQPVTPAQQRAVFVQRLVGKPEPHVLIVGAMLNSFEGEFVPLAVTVRPNPLVYSAGQVIAETRVDGRLAQDVVLAAIDAFVTGTLGPKAVQDGLLPRLGRPAPLGEIEPNEVLRLVDEIRQTGRVIRVQFLAKADTRAADPLRLEFRLR